MLTPRPLAFVVAGVGLVVASVVLALESTAAPAPELAPLPERLADLPLGDSVYGAKALEELNHLHADNLPVRSAAIGRYGRPTEATLWVSGAATTWQASRMLESMVSRIQTVDTPFVPQGPVDVGGRPVQRLTGFGQEHYLFQSGRYVVWLAVSADRAELALKSLVEAYP